MTGQPGGCWCHTTDSALPSQDASDSAGKLSTHDGNPESRSGSLSHAETA